MGCLSTSFLLLIYQLVIHGLIQRLDRNVQQNRGERVPKTHHWGPPPRGFTLLKYLWVSCFNNIFALRNFLGTSGWPVVNLYLCFLCFSFKFPNSILWISPQLESSLVFSVTLLPLPTHLFLLNQESFHFHFPHMVLSYKSSILFRELIYFLSLKS